MWSHGHMYKNALIKINLNLRSILGLGISALNLHERTIPRKVCPLKVSASMHVMHLL
jgi:hypothetical protein